MFQTNRTNSNDISLCVYGLGSVTKAFFLGQTPVLHTSHHTPVDRLLQQDLEAGGMKGVLLGKHACQGS